jgi:hypothetical protein
MLALDFAARAQQMKAIGGKPGRKSIDQGK